MAKMKLTTEEKIKYAQKELRKLKKNWLEADEELGYLESLSEYIESNMEKLKAEIKKLKNKL